MTDSPVPQEPESPPSEPRRSRSSYAWRVLAIVVVLAAMAATAHFLRGPGRSSGGAKDARSSAPDLTARPPAPDPNSPAAKAAAANLRDQMGGIIANLAQEGGEFDDPANQTPEARRKFVEDLFRLQSGYPKSAAPPDLVPPGAETIVVFPSPDDPATSMIFLRIRKDISDAMSDFQRLYSQAGWKLVEPVSSDPRKDSGWLMRFSQPGRDRVVYALQRRSGKETLAAVYDSRY